MTAEKTEAAAIADLAQKPFIEMVNGVPLAFAPNSSGWGMQNLAELLPAPRRKFGTVEIAEVDSFIIFAKKHGSLSETNIYLDVDYAKNKFAATAVFNDHGETSAGWQDHRALFSPRQSEEWHRWAGKNKQRLSQIELARFLEENISDISTAPGMPSGSDVLTFVSCLEETRKVKYGSAINLQNGMVQLEFIEDGDKAQKGKLEMFREFSVGIAPFFGGTAYQIKAFLRYRIDRNDGEISFWYELQRTDKVLEDASSELILKIKGETGIPVIFGVAPRG